MSEESKILNEWLNGLDDKHPVEWSLLPDIGLYMDQVQTYIDRQLSLYLRDENDRLLTPAMINNYIKDGLIPRAEAKKYTQLHLALLTMIGTLKQVLSMHNLSQLFAPYRDADDVARLYGNFLQIQHSALLDSAGQALRQASENESDTDDADSAQALRRMALQLSVEARTRILIVEKILALIGEKQNSEELEKSNKKKTEK